MQSTRSRGSGISGRVRVTGIIATLVAVVVMLSTVLVIAPAGTPLRAEVRSVALPYFGQAWRIFAPEILKVNRSLEIRVAWRNDERDLVTSDWVSISDIELRAAKGSFSPSLVRGGTWAFIGTYLQRYGALDEDQRARVQNTFIERHEGRFRPISSDDLVEELGPGDGDVIAFLRADYMLMRHVTLYATAGFGEDIERVQWRIVRETPNEFVNRFDSEPQFSQRITTFGWRHSNVRTDPGVIEEYRALIRRYGGTSDFERAAANAEQ